MVSPFMTTSTPALPAMISKARQTASVLAEASIVIPGSLSQRVIASIVIDDEILSTPSSLSSVIVFPLKESSNVITALLSPVALAIASRREIKPSFGSTRSSTVVTTIEGDSLLSYSYAPRSVRLLEERVIPFSA